MPLLPAIMAAKDIWQSFLFVKNVSLSKKDTRMTMRTANQTGFKSAGASSNITANAPNAPRDLNYGFYFDMGGGMLRMGM